MCGTGPAQVKLAESQEPYRELVLCAGERCFGSVLVSKNPQVVDDIIGYTSGAPNARIQFSISEPVGVFEAVVCEIKGDGMGAAHQYAMEQVFIEYPELIEEVRNAHSPRITMRGLVEGDIHNDFPVQNVTGEQFSRIMEPILAEDADYLTMQAFRIQPNREWRYAVAGVYKRVPAEILRLCGVSTEVIVRAKALLEYRTRLENTHMHFMLETEDDRTEAVCRRAVRQARQWMAEALDEEDIFKVGKTCHMVQDSFSPAHCLRSGPSPKHRWGAVRDVVWFGHQSDESHGYLESIRALRNPKRPAYQRVKWSCPPQHAILTVFLDAIKQIREKPGDRDHKLKVIESVRKPYKVLMRDYVFPYDPEAYEGVKLF